jgi:hypothetical protein
MRTRLSFLLAAFLALSLRAQEPPASPARSGGTLVPGPATLLGDHVNVRGQPSFTGEAVIKLNQGDVVEILEVIVREKPAPGEPAQWARIRMPTNAPVFAFTAFLDPTNKTVKPARLNLRGGPGENFSVVGRLNRGDQVTELLTEGDWTKIEAPTNAFAFVAAEFLQQAAPPTPEAVPAPAPEPTPAPEPVPPPAPSTDAGPTSTPPVAEAPAPAAVIIAPTNTPVAVPAPAPEPIPTSPTNAAPESAAPPVAATTNAGPRVVVREGIVRSTLSIQAPSEWELVDVRHRRTMAFLLPPNKEMKLVELWDKRVLVTGTESIERRWPNTPVLTIQRIETVTE